MNVYIKGNSVSLLDTNIKGQGGEAVIYDIGGGMVAKLFKQPDHPDFAGNCAEQEKVQRRLEEHQEKLRAFPKNLPANVIAPVDLLTNRGGTKVLGFTMPFVQDTEVLFMYTDKQFRSNGIGNEMIPPIFLNLHTTVKGVHAAGVVLGDFNDLNELVENPSAKNAGSVYIIDADSAQFGKFITSMFTAKFVDPKLCDQNQTRPMLVKPHNQDSDWYAFAIMLMQSLLFVGPFGGVYRPKNRNNFVQPDARAINGISVFHPEVIYPKNALHYRVLPDDILQRFHLVFEKRERGEFPEALIKNLRWTKCTKCGAEHARAICPECAQAAPAAIKETTTIRGQVTATRIFVVSGAVIHASMQSGKLVWLYHDGQDFRREDKGKVFDGKLDPQMRFRISGNNTLVAKGNLLINLVANKNPDKLSVDIYGQNLPVVDGNSSHYYWLRSGQLMKNGPLGPQVIGSVLRNQTLFWVGEKFGFGFYRVGGLCIGFVFDAELPGLNDSVKVSPVKGQMIDATCVFSDKRAWFFTSSREAGKTVNQCTVILSDGTVEARAQAEENDGSWLENIRGHAPAGNALFVSTDAGLVRVEVQGGQLVKTRDFPDTEPFVDSDTQLFVGNDGLYAVSKKEIVNLKMR